MTYICRLSRRSSAGAATCWSGCCGSARCRRMRQPIRWPGRPRSGGPTGTLTTGPRCRATLRAQLTDLGCVLAPPRAMARLVARASMLSWKDPRFVADLGRWTSADPAAPAGMTPAGLPLTRFEWAALRLAIRAGRLPAPVALAYASRDIRLLARARAVAVLGAADLERGHRGGRGPPAAPLLGDDHRGRLRLPPDLHRGGPAGDRPRGRGRDRAAGPGGGVPHRPPAPPGAGVQPARAWTTCSCPQLGAWA